MSKILLVDDDPAMRRLLRRFLDREYEVLESDSGVDAVQIVENHQPEMVLLNLEMPGIDGIETCRRLKSLPPILQPVVMIVSAHTEIASRNAACLAGADDYLPKPVQRERLLSRVRLHFQCTDRYKQDTYMMHATHANRNDRSRSLTS